ncbi:hypothetical protein GCM10027436_25230 [Actinophytocola sediminis]
MAGYGVLCERVCEQLSTELRFIVANAGGSAGFTGVLSVLAEPANDYADLASRRLSDHATALAVTASELKRAAWAYSGADRETYERFDPAAYPTSVAPEPEYRDFPDADRYPVTDPTDALRPPDIEDPDIRAKVDEVGGALDAIDDAIVYVTGWSPVTAITRPISGNWNALSAAGQVLIDVGNALDGSLANLTESLGRLDAGWDGGAAQSFSTYLGRLVEGADQEAALNRIVGQVYRAAAARVEKVATFVVEKLKSAIDLIGERLKSALIPFYGWYKLVEAVRTCVNLFEQARELVESVERLMARVESVIAFAKDPVGQTTDAGRDWLESKLAPIRHRVDEYGKRAETAADIVELSRVDDWSNAPDRGYSTGKDMRRSR